MPKVPPKPKAKWVPNLAAAMSARSFSLPGVAHPVRVSLSPKAPPKRQQSSSAASGPAVPRTPELTEMARAKIRAPSGGDQPVEEPRAHGAGAPSDGGAAVLAGGGGAPGDAAPQDLPAAVVNDLENVYEIDNESEEDETWGPWTG